MDDDEPHGSPPVYIETGASWYWLLAGPVAGLAMMFVQFRAGVGFQPFVPTLFLVLVSGMLAVQIKAGRIHTSVELTETSLREGTEVMSVDEIVAVYPEPENSVKAAGFMEKWQGRTLGVNATGPLEQWQTARALGELSGVPRGRTPIGLRLTGGRFVQAWARHSDALRAELTRLVEARQP
jgi:hypothetical protein